MKNELVSKRDKLKDRKLELESELFLISKKYNKKYNVIYKQLTMIKKELERI